MEALLTFSDPCDSHRVSRLAGSPRGGRQSGKNTIKMDLQHCCVIQLSKWVDKAWFMLLLVSSDVPALHKLLKPRQSFYCLVSYESSTHLPLSLPDWGWAVNTQTGRTTQFPQVTHKHKHSLWWMIQWLGSAKKHWVSYCCIQFIIKWCHMTELALAKLNRLTTVVISSPK